MYKKINLKENDIVLNRRLTNSGVTTGQINSFLKGSGYKLELKSCVCLVDEFDEIQVLTTEPLRTIGLKCIAEMINETIYKNSAQYDKDKSLTDEVIKTEKMEKIDYIAIIESLNFRINAYRQMKSVRGKFISKKEYEIDVKTLEHFKNNMRTIYEQASN